ncbi:alpha amylase family protein [Sutcliffiella cohnii]|uniref:alpha amylase family protein n=1 Tax=Sutcliffiella cohnii TaxID=33932 RepID=UPI002E20F6AC|nr:alpha amylase family protein [Sutcliffiella cohnii]
MNQTYVGAKVLWVDFLANGRYLIKEEKRQSYIQQAKEAGFSHVVVDAKIPYGYVTYHSSLAPHVSSWERFREWEGKDYVQLMIDVINEHGLHAIVKFDVFAEGSINDTSSKAHANKEWQVTYYHLDASTSTPTFTKAEEFHEPSIFVNPIHPEVQKYELSLIEEVVQKYDFHAVVLDRCRYPNINGDFSEFSRNTFERYIGKKIECWPEDILIPKKNGVQPGSLYKKWLTWRATNITNFVHQAKGLVKEKNEQVGFGIYVGSWYPEFYEEGVNWASVHNEVTFPWMEEGYMKSGYADCLDFLITGCYYPDVFEGEAIQQGKEKWRSVEGAIELSKKVTAQNVPVIAGLFLQEYEGDAFQFKKAVEECVNSGDGLMIFDAIYLELYDWWQVLIEEQKEGQK